MMSANCSVVVTLSSFSRPCRTQCCGAKCLISTCFNRPGPRRVAVPMHADASSFRQAVMVYPSSLFLILNPTRAQKHKQLQSKTHFHHCSELLVSVFETNQPRTLLQASTDPPAVDLRFSSRSAHDPSHQPTNSVNCSRGRTNSRCMYRVP